MEERHFILYQNKHINYQGGQAEVIKTLSVEEVMSDGKRKTVYSDILFHNESNSPVMRSIVQKVVPKQSERRVWHIERRAA